MRLTKPVFDMTDGNEWVRSTHGETSTAPAGWAMSRSLRTVKSATQSPAPAESPAMTIFSGGTALCSASDGGRVKYKSETFLISVARRIHKLRVELTCCNNILS